MAREGWRCRPRNQNRECGHRWCRRRSWLTKGRLWSPTSAWTLRCPLGKAKEDSHVGLGIYEGWHWFGQLSRNLDEERAYLRSRLPSFPRDWRTFENSGRGKNILISFLWFYLKLLAFKYSGPAHSARYPHFLKVLWPTVVDASPLLSCLLPCYSSSPPSPFNPLRIVNSHCPHSSSLLIGSSSISCLHRFLQINTRVLSFSSFLLTMEKCLYLNNESMSPIFIIHYLRSSFHPKLSPLD